MSYRSWILARLCVLTRLPFLCWCCCCCSVGCLSLSGWLFCLSCFTSALRSEMTFLALTRRRPRFLTTSSFVLTRFAYSSASLSFSWSSRASSWFCSFWFWNASPTLSWSFSRASYFFWSLSYKRSGLDDPDFAVFFLFCCGSSEHKHCRLSPFQTTHLFSQWNKLWSPPHTVHLQVLWDISN